MRDLLAYEDTYRSYGQALAGAVGGLRPGVEVSLVHARRLALEVARLDPHLVICNRPNDTWTREAGRRGWRSRKSRTTPRRRAWAGGAGSCVTPGWRSCLPS
jgi:hypothetical protein